MTLPRLQTGDVSAASFKQMNTKVCPGKPKMMMTPDPESVLKHLKAFCNNDEKKYILFQGDYDFDELYSKASTAEILILYCMTRKNIDKHGDEVFEAIMQSTPFTLKSRKGKEFYFKNGLPVYVISKYNYAAIVRM